ncbi:MAG: hypothetical protein WCW66_02460 [Patescibacteria group bacterium]
MINEEKKRFFRLFLSLFLTIFLTYQILGIVDNQFDMVNRYSGLLYTFTSICILVISFLFLYILFSFVLRIEGSKKELFSKKTINTSNAAITLLFIVLTGLIFMVLIIGSNLFLSGEAAIFIMFFLIIPFIAISLLAAGFIIKLIFGKKNEQGKITKQQ